MHRDLDVRHRLPNVFFFFPIPSRFFSIFGCISISSSSLFVMSDSGFLLLAMISIVSSMDNLLLFFAHLFLFFPSSGSSLLLFTPSVLFVSFVFTILFKFALELDPFCPLFLIVGGVDPFV